MFNVKAGVTQPIITSGLQRDIKCDSYSTLLYGRVYTVDLIYERKMHTIVRASEKTSD